MKARKGDYVECLVDDYSYYAKGSKALVQDVGKQDSTGNPLIKLYNPLSPVGYSWYLAKGFKHLAHYGNNEETKKVAYEKTKYFAAVINEEASTPTFLVPDVDFVGPLRDSKSEALKDAEIRIRGDDAGKKFIILQIIALIQEEDPRPPIKITEYR
jgi:hypothetical protein